MEKRNNKRDSKPRGKNSPRSNNSSKDRNFKRNSEPGKGTPQRSQKSNNNEESDESEGIRLNKFIAHSGICSRREADELIKTGCVTVNGTMVSEMGHKVDPNDIINVEGESIKPERKYYVLLNKPKGYITTTDDPHNRNTVMQLIHKACKARIYPVGRLDRNTSGLLLFTNDGDLAKKLTHPSHNIRKLYHASLDNKINHKHLEEILEGFELEDGFVKADEISYTGAGEDKREVGIVLHSGKNRIVRRIFAHLGYEVMKLDRVIFAGLTKKDLPRGRWRHLTDKEVIFLKMLK